MVSIALCRTAVPIKGGKGWHVPFWTFSDAVIGDGRARWITLTSLSGQRDHIHVSISIGEASVRTKATDPERRKTPRVRTALPGLRVEPRWLPVLTRVRRAVPKLRREGCVRPFGHMSPLRHS